MYIYIYIKFVCLLVCLCFLLAGWVEIGEWMVGMGSVHVCQIRIKPFRGETTLSNIHSLISSSPLPKSHTHPMNPMNPSTKDSPSCFNKNLSILWLNFFF